MGRRVRRGGGSGLAAEAGRSPGGVATAVFVTLLSVAAAPVELRAEETPEARLVRALGGTRAHEPVATGLAFFEASRTAVREYQQASRRPPPFPERLKRFTQALREQGLLTECERLQFAEIAASRRADEVLGVAGRVDSEAIVEALRQVSRDSAGVLGAQRQVGGQPGMLVSLLLQLFDPGRRTFSPLVSGRGHESFVFCGEDASVTPESLAQLFAPVLWFSYDEPLYLERVAIPQALPEADSPGRRDVPTVYYQVTAGSLLGGRLGPYEGTAPRLDLRSGEVRKNLKIRYFFYYQRDTGANGHPHDVEGAELFVDVRDWALGGEGQRCVRVAPRMLRGLAHGLTWSANHLRFEGGRGCDAAFPLILLVEEGKHASCPDRNGDGLYTPGYDVNFWVNEAWGVRDDFGSERVHSRFTAESGKPRRQPTQLMPPLVGVREADVIRQLYCDRTAVATGSTFPGTPLLADQLSAACRGRWYRTYELKGADPELARSIRDQDQDLGRRLADQEFGELWDPLRTLWDRGLRERANVEFTAEDGEFLVVPVVTPFMKGLPLLDGWLTFEAALSPGDAEVRRVAFTYSRSASRPIDWYVKANFRELGDSRWRWDGVFPDVSLDSRLEFGVKIRFQYDQVLGKLPLIGKIPVLSRSFLGLRLGVEAQPRDGQQGRGLRFRWSVGGGAW